jgi:ABC-type sugar transport system permease subunit
MAGLRAIPTSYYEAARIDGVWAKARSCGASRFRC